MRLGSDRAVPNPLTSWVATRAAVAMSVTVLCRALGAVAMAGVDVGASEFCISLVIEIRFRVNKQAYIAMLSPP